MVFTNAQTTAFFQDANQMAIPARTVTQLATEGIVTVDDLGEFDAEDFKQIVDNLRKPPRIPNPDGGNDLIAQEPFVIGAKSLKRLKVGAQAIKYYEMIGRNLSPSSVHYTNTLKNFELQWNSLVSRKKEDVPDVPKITRHLKVTKWSESFKDFLSKVIGNRHAPLSYVIREQVEVPIVAPPLDTNQPHSVLHGSVEGELIARLSHNSPIYRDDNKQVYLYLEEATRGTIYGASIKPFTRTKDGRGSYLALISQHAGVDKWEKELQDQEKFLYSRKWKGNSNFSLDKFIENHRAAFILMQQCAEHVDHQLPNDHTRVRYLLEAIDCSDPALHARKAQIETDTGPDGKRNNFEAAAAFLLPADPVARKRKSNGQGSGTYVADVSSATGLKPNTGSTGVELRYYKKNEYKQLNDQQRDELREWRKKMNKSGNKRKSDEANLPGKPGSDPKSPTKKHFRREIKSVMSEFMKELELKKEKEESEVGEICKVLANLKSPSGSGKVASTSGVVNTQVESTARNVHSIIKRGAKPGSLGEQ